MVAMSFDMSSGAQRSPCFRASKDHRASGDSHGYILRCVPGLLLVAGCWLKKHELKRAMAKSKPTAL